MNKIACAAQCTDAQIQLLMSDLKRLRTALQSSAQAPSPPPRSIASTRK